MSKNFFQLWFPHGNIGYFLPGEKSEKWSNVANVREGGLIFHGRNSRQAGSFFA
jgi:hypothetical protein